MVLEEGARVEPVAQFVGTIVHSRRLGRAVVVQTPHPRIDSIQQVSTFGITGQGQVPAYPLPTPPSSSHTPETAQMTTPLMQ